MANVLPDRAAAFQARHADSSAVMSDALAVSTSRQDSSSRWLLGSLALNLFFVGVAIAIAVWVPAPSYWDRDVFVRVELLATALSPTDANILRSQISANRAVIEDTQTANDKARDHIHEVLRQEPFDVEALRGAMAKTRTAQQAFEQTTQNVFASVAAKISPAGRGASSRPYR
jgi:uncharacterized membrane protein